MTPTVKTERKGSPCELKMGVPNSICAIRTKHSLTMGLRESLRKLNQRIANAMLCELQFETQHFELPHKVGTTLVKSTTYIFVLLGVPRDFPFRNQSL